MIFSHRFHQILADGRLQLDLPEQVRSKVWAQLLRYDSSIRVRPDQGDSWERNSSYLQETGDELKREYGWVIGESWPEVDTEKCRREGPGLGPFLLGCNAASVFDFIQIFVRFLAPDERVAFQAKVNGIFELEGLCWRMAGDDFLKLDGDFMGAMLRSTAHDSLTGAGFDGAIDEFSTAQHYLTAGDAKDAILYAGKSFESSLKTVTGLQAGNANTLLKEFVSKGFIDDLPEAQRGGFHEQVLKTLPFLRNQLAGHGQGIDVVQVPMAYAELGVQLAAAFHNFFIAKHLEAAPAPKPDDAGKQDSWRLEDSDDIPF